MPSTSTGTALAAETARRGEAEIFAAAERLLAAADVGNRLPTPVEDLVAAADLVVGSDEIFSPGILARAPKEVREAVKGLIGRVRAILDRREREIYVSPEITLVGRRNFHMLHEVGHEIVPWQSKLAYADDDIRISWATRVRFEREANQTAAELLFQRDRFRRMAAEYATGFEPVVELAEMFGSSIHAAFRRYVETHRGAVCGIVVECNAASRDPLVYRRREAMSSATWEERFGSPQGWPHLLDARRYEFLQLAARARIISPLATEWQLADLAGDAVTLRVQLFSNTYKTLILISVRQRQALKRRRVIVAQ